MLYYRVKQIGDGTKGNPYRPDIPGDVSCLCYRHDDGIFLVVTEDTIPGVHQIYPALARWMSLERGLDYENVKLDWHVGRRNENNQND